MNIGYIYAALAYGSWGLIPVYFKLVDHISPLEMASNRILWSVVFVILIVSVKSKWENVFYFFKNSKNRYYLIVSASIIFSNWLVFIWAVNNDRMMEASLGYYVNPLIMVCLGCIFLKERHSKKKWFSILLAFTGVMIQVINLGSFPWVSLVLAISFGFYALLHKRISTDSLTSLLIETTFLLPLALSFMGWLYFNGEGPAIRTGNDWLLLILSGPITAVPLLFFSVATKKLPLSVMGFFQYLSPTIVFILAIFVYGEKIDAYKLITFVFIWVALAIFTLENYFLQKKQKNITIKKL